MTWENTVRSFLAYAREPMLTISRIIQSVLTATIVGLIFYKVGNLEYTEEMIEKNGWDRKSAFIKMTGCLFVATLNQGLLASLPMLIQYPSFIAVFNREYLNTANNAFAMYWGRTVVELLYQSIIPFFFTSIFYYMTGMSYGSFADHWESFLFFSVMIIALSWTAVNFAQSLSILFLDIKISLYVAVLFWFPMAIYTGLMKPLGGDQIPVYFEWLTKVSFVRYAYTGLLVNYLENPESLLLLFPEQNRDMFKNQFLKNNMGVEPDVNKWELLIYVVISGAVLKVLGYIFLAGRVSTLKK